jgi:hypothetical protein
MDTYGSTEATEDPVLLQQHSSGIRNPDDAIPAKAFAMFVSSSLRIGSPRGDVVVEYCPIGDMVSDVLTKPLQGSASYMVRSLLLNMPVARRPVRSSNLGAQKGWNLSHA